MKVELETLDKVRKSIEVVLDEDKVNELREQIYEELKKRAKIKGFRPGKVPRSVIQAYYKDYIEDELKQKMVEQTIGDALSETHIDPLSEPRIEFIEEDGRHGYKMECEVVPEFDLPDYEGIPIEAEKVAVTEEELTKRLEGLREMHAQPVNREGEEGAQKGDLAIIRYEGFLNGKPVKDVKSDSYPVDLGSSNLMPEFESALLGMKVGEEKDVDLSFPDDYPDKNIASKTLLIKVVLKELKEKKLPELNDELAKDVGFENLEALREGVRKEIEKEKEAHRKQAISEQIASFLIEKTDIPVPSRLLQKRVDGYVQEARTRMKGAPMSEEQGRSFDAALGKEYEPQAEKRIKVEMILSKIAEREGIKVDDSEVEERLKRIAEETKRAYDYIKGFYDQYNLTGNLKSSMLEEKTVDFLVNKTTIKEKE